VFVFAKVLQAIGFADVGYGLFVGMTQGDLWKELYMALTGVAFFYTGRLLERWS
jgi:hypothetical protein